VIRRLVYFPTISLLRRDANHPPLVYSRVRGVQMLEQIALGWNSDCSTFRNQYSS
jgi:hypothetical protein